MHICHDGRYPEPWTLPVIFGARLILHPSNGGHVSGSIDAFEAGAYGALYRSLGGRRPVLPGAVP